MNVGLLLIILVLIFFKQILLIASSPFIYIWCKYQKNRSAKYEIVETDISAPPDSFSLFRMIRQQLSALMSSLVRYSVFQVAKIPSFLIRNFFYKRIFLVRMMEKTVVHFGAEIRSPYNLVIGKGSIIGDRAILDARNRILIGENVNFSSDVAIWTEQHDHSDPLFRCNSGSHFQVVIGDRAWLGPRAIILPGVSIGEGAVVAAGAVVTKDVEPFSIVAGIPAKKIGDRNSNLTYEFSGRPGFFL